MTSGSEPDGPQSADPPAWIQVDTVEALVETARSLLKDEDAREQSITSRAVGLSGFSGLIVSVAGPLSATQHSSTQLSAQWAGAVFVLLIASVGALLATITVAVLGVLRPKEFRTIAVGEIERYPLPQYVGQRRVMVQGRLLRGLVESLASERLKNNAKARWLGHAYLSLLAGLVGVSTLAVTLVSHSAGQI